MAMRTTGDDAGVFLLPKLTLLELVAMLIHSEEP